MTGVPIGNVKCAVVASELRSIAESTSDYLQKRISVLYDMAIKYGHDVIVLGAWGCGAFKETDDDISILLYRIQKSFEKI